MSIEKRLAELRARCEKSRGMDFCPDPQAKVMAVWENHGYMPQLIDALEVMREALEKSIAPLPLEENPDLTMKDAFYIWSERIQESRQALAKAEEILS